MIENKRKVISMEIPAGFPRLAALAQRAKELYDRAGLKRHNWSHITRNYNRAKRILEKEPGNVEITLSGDRFEPLLPAGRAYYTETGKRLDNGDLAAIINLAKRLRK